MDRSGRLYAVHYDSIRPIGRKYYQALRVDCVVDDPICSGCDSDRWKRLVVDSSRDLYLVLRTVYCSERMHFKVHKLHKICSADFPGCRGNYVIFYKDCFPKYERTSSDESFFEGASEELEIGVFHFGDGEAGLISAYSGYLWPPPT